MHELVPYDETNEVLERKHRDGKWGCVDQSCREVVHCQYDDYPGSFSEGLAAVKLTDKYISSRIYSSIWYRLGFVRLPQLVSKYGFIDKSGREAISFKYDDAKSFSEGLAAVKLDGKWGFVDKSGRGVIPLKYDGCAASFSEDLAVVSLDGKYLCVEKLGRESMVSSCRSTPKAFQEKWVWGMPDWLMFSLIIIGVIIGAIRGCGT